MREFKHTAHIKGKSYDITANSAEELKEKLRKLEEFVEDDGA